jgi:hypothetical protein
MKGLELEEDCAKEAVINKERIANDFIARWV